MNYSKTLGRVVAVGFLCLPLIAGAWLFYLFYLHCGLRAEDISAQRQTLGRIEALIAQADEIDRRLEIQKSAEAGRYFFAAPSTPLMVAQLQQRLQSLVAAHQAQFIRATEIPPREIDGMNFAGVKLELSGPIESLAKTLESIESAVPLLLIERAELTGNPLNAVDPRRQPVLALRLDVMGARLAAPAASASEVKIK